MTFIDEDDFSSHHDVHDGDVFGNLFLLAIYCTNVKRLLTIFKNIYLIVYIQFKL